MAAKRQTFDNGTQGEVISAANSAASGDALSSITQAGTGQGIYTVGSAIRGAKGAYVTGAASDTFAMVMSNTSSTSGSAQLYFKIVSYPSVAGAFFSIKSSTGNIALFSLGTTGVLTLQDSTGAVLKNFNSSIPLTLNTPYYVQIQGVPNASTSAGTIAGQLYADNNSLIDSYSSTSVNAGTTLDVETAQAGKIVTASDGFAMHLDELAFDTGTSTALIAYPYTKFNGAEGGFEGVTATFGNSGGLSGDGFSSISLGTGSITYTTAQKHSGQLSYNITPGPGSLAALQYSFVVSNNRFQLTARVYVYFTGQPTAATQFLTIGRSGLTTTFVINTTGTPFLQDGGGTIAGSTGATSITLNTWYRFEMTMKIGTTTSNGTVTASIYTGDSTTSPLYTYSSNARNTGTTGLSFVSFGKVSNAGNWSTMYLDDLAVNESAYIGPANTVQAPWFRA